MPLVTERSQTRHGSWLVWGAVLLLSALIGAAAWSLIVAPVRVPLGSHAVAFGQLYTTSRPPPPGHRPIGMLGNPNAHSHVFRAGDRLYFVGWK